MPFRAIRSYVLALATLAAASCAGLEKSENVLSPTIAGPIPGVSIEQPLALEPKDGRAVEVANQPITLRIQNSPNNSQRIVTYAFELATDNAFSNTFFSRGGVPAGEGGQTSFRLPEALATGRTYYWRARGGDGANDGPFTAPAHFNVFTPIVIDRPTLIQPVNNTQLDSALPRFIIGNAARSGPVGALSYQIEIADGDSFANKYAIWNVGEQPGQTRLDSPAPLPGSKQFFWRARAYDTKGLGGDWSSAAVFRTPAIIVAPPPPPGGGGSCIAQGTPLGVLQCRRNQYGAHMSATELVTFLKASAKDISTLGTNGGPWGILVKTSGAQCNGYSCDILCLGNGSGQEQRDVLIDAEGSQTPIWGGPIGSPAIRPCEAQ